MRYFAELDENNLVINAIVMPEYFEDEDGNLVENTETPTSSDENHPMMEYSVVDTSITNNPAAIGFTYDENLNAFIPPQPDPTYILNTQTFEWEPDENLEYDLHGDGKLYRYNKELTGWIPTWDPED